MKKILTAALCLICVLTAFNAFAAGTASSFDASEVSEGIELQIGGRAVPLAFDNSAEYSAIVNDTVQASFYAYSDNSDYLYELYMIFPNNVESGSVVTPEYAMENDPDCSIVMIISTRDTEQYYLAGQIDGVVYPTASHYSITFDSVSASGDARVYTGTLSASLIEMEMDTGEELATFSIVDAPFSFTMPIGASSGSAEPFPETPDETPDPFDTEPAPDDETPDIEFPQATPALQTTPDYYRV